LPTLSSKLSLPRPLGPASFGTPARHQPERWPAFAGIRNRELSLITLDSPTWAKGANRPSSFWDHVILPLVKLKELAREDNNLYKWLEIMFEFCRNKPFAYFSYYKPGPRIHAIARRFRVRVLHVPISRIPPRMLDRHAGFRFMYMTATQWEDLLEKIEENKRPWMPSRVDRGSGARPVPFRAAAK
jgi:hypothetical protein